jgi:RNA polymerase sigma factor (sigma-70 family)
MDLTASTAPDGNEAPERLVALVACERDRDAFAALYRLFAPRVAGYGLRGRLDPQEVEDFVAAVMTAVWEGAGDYDPAQATVGTWIFTIARNRRAERLLRGPRPEIAADDPMLAPAPASAAERLVLAQSQGALQKVIENMPVQQSDLLRLAYMEGKTHEMIALERNIPPGAVGTRLRAALEHLKGAMKESA